MKRSGCGLSDAGRSRNWPSGPTRSSFAVLALAGITALLGAGRLCAQTVIYGPFGSSEFGAAIAVLPNGNLVVTDPADEAPNATGAVYLYTKDGTLISKLFGTAKGDQVGGGGIVVLPSGNFVAISPAWHSMGNPFAGVGAVTFIDGTTGLSGAVTSSNSLVGSGPGQTVGSGGVVVLTNGNYVVVSPFGGPASPGAVTWGGASTGVSGEISASNSLMGSSNYDEVGSGGVVALSNGNYVVSSPSWTAPGTLAGAGAGAATWGNGTTGTSGTVSASNSLVGSSAGDQVGGITALRNGNYVVTSPHWTSSGTANAGAATLGNGTSGTFGAITSANSLIGNASGDLVGSGGAVALSNGNYVIVSSSWNGNTGAATWCSGTLASTGIVSSANSLTGALTTDAIGSKGVVALSNGNYVIVSPNWSNGAASGAGAVTWGNGSTGSTGIVSAANSLVGTQSGDQVGSEGVAALAGGNYVVASSFWNGNRGAVTWADGGSNTSGTVSAANSLIGNPSDRVGFPGVVALGNGNYVVASALVDVDGVADVGAVTWIDGAGVKTGIVSSTNSIVGSQPNDRVGFPGIVALSNGNYVIDSIFWADGATTSVGAITWMNGRHAAAGTVSRANSLVGTTAYDELGLQGISTFANGCYAVISPAWDTGSAADAGLISVGRGWSGPIGPADLNNGIAGGSASAGSFLQFAYDAARDRLVVGDRLNDAVSILTPDQLLRSTFD